MRDYSGVDDNIGNDSQAKLIEKIVNDFKIAIDFYRMEYSEDLRTLFNEFGYLLLCRLSYARYLDIPVIDGITHTYREKGFLREEKASELAPEEIERIIRLLCSTFQDDVVIIRDELKDDRFSVFVDFSLSIKRHSILRQMLLVIKDLILLREQSDDMSTVYHAVCDIHTLCSNSSKANPGRFILPDKIVKQLIDWLYTEIESGQPKQPVTVFDPQYGAGNMLNVAKYYFEDADLYGFENNQTFRISAQILAILSNTMIKTYDGEFLKDKLENQYDIVLANPVFNSDGIPKNAYLQSLPNELGEIKSQYSLSIMRILQAVAPAGHAIIITPDSFLFSSKREYIAVRGWLLNCYCLEAVISLPEKTFYPQAATKASALIVSNRFRSGSGTAYGQTKEVAFYQMVQGAENNSDTNIEMLENWRQNDFWSIDIDTIRDAGWNLLPEHYRPLKMRELAFEDPAVLLEELLREQNDVLRDMENLLEEVENIQ